MSDLRRWIKIYDDAEVVSPDFCKRAIAFFEASSEKLKLNEPWQRYHQLRSLQTTELFEDIRSIVAATFDRYKEDTGCGTLNYVDRIEAPSVSRYDVADADGPHQFHSHADAWSMETASRQASVILYLNDVDEGGETIFDDGLAVKPKEGRVLVFPSGLCFQHRAEPPKSGSKYVLVAWLHFNGTGHSYVTLPLRV